MDKKTYPSELKDKFMLRLPDGMRTQIKAAADESGRSMNAEIVARLEESFKPPALFDQLQADIAKLIEKVDRMERKEG